MKIAVMGAGAVGCYYGGLLARAGHDVQLIGRQALADAVAAGGLVMDTQQFQATVHPGAGTDPAAARDAAVVLFCVKSPDTEASALQLRPHLARDAVVVSLQNGVDNAERLRALLPQPVLAAVVYVATEMGGPARVVHHGRGELVIEDGPHSAPLADVLRAAGVTVQLSADVRGALWAKLALNCAYNALSAIHDEAYGALVQRAGVPEQLRGLMQECLDVAAADGVQMPGGVWDAVQAIARTMPGQRSSMAQDLARGRRTEIDQINGHVARRGAALGVPTPLNSALVEKIRQLESALPRAAR